MVRLLSADNSGLFSLRILNTRPRSYTGSHKIIHTRVRIIVCRSESEVIGIASEKLRGKSIELRGSNQLKKKSNNKHN